MDTLFFILSLCLKIFTVYFACVAAFALLRRRKYPHAAPRTRFAVIAAARNEEAVIADLVGSILEQDYPPQLRDIYVIPNNCTDATEAAARAAGAEIIRCIGPVRGKGDALREAFRQLKDRGYDAFIVFDADNVAAPDYLSRVNDAVCAGAGVWKTRLKAANPTAAGVAGCYGLYNTCFDLVWNRPRAACGLSAKLVGTGFGFTSAVLEALGGWNTSTIAEDAEFAAQCARAGHRVWWVPDAVSYDEEPTSFRLSLHQRKRWCSGVMQVAKQEVRQLWSGSVPRPMLRWDMTMFLLAPFSQAMSALLLAGSVLTSLIQQEWSVLLLGAAYALLYYMGGALLGAALCLAGGYGLRGMGRTVALFPVFMASWLPLQVISLFRDTKHWKPIAHTGRCRSALPACPHTGGERA